ncbi:hypothetical protein KAT36_03740 [Candidatus Pacearchaeota archaeon]|nr:hypothetical protein [Candidatus Pacearchaeota archaeon]
MALNNSMSNKSRSDRNTPHIPTTTYQLPTTNYSKRGIILTFITITILSLFAISYGAYTLIQDHSSINNRITTLNNFVTSVEQDLPRQTYISGYRAIFLFNKQIVDTGTYISDIDSTLNEIFFNGTLNGNHQELMDDATFSSFQSLLSSNAEKINANVQLLNPTISITQDNPWNLKITLNTTLIIQDNNNLASWNKTTSTTSSIPIENFDDPIYSANTAGKVLNKINQTPYQVFVTGSDYTNLTTHFQNSLYKTSISAPSFLMRLQGNLSASPNGIESLVNPQKLIDQDVTVKYKSVIDYIYFSTSDPTKYTVPSVSNLILDNQNNHLAIYNVSGVVVPA